MSRIVFSRKIDKGEGTYAITTSYPSASSGTGVVVQSAVRNEMLWGNVVLPLFGKGGMGSDPNSCSQDAGK